MTRTTSLIKRLLAAGLSACVLLAVPGVDAFAQVVGRSAATPVLTPSGGAAGAAPVQVTFSAPSLSPTLSSSVSLVLPAGVAPTVAVRPTAASAAAVPNAAAAAPAAAVQAAASPATAAALTLAAPVLTLAPAVMVAAPRVDQAGAAVAAETGGRTAPAATVLKQGLSFSRAGQTAGPLFDGAAKGAVSAVAPEGAPVPSQAPRPARTSGLAVMAGKTAAAAAVVAMGAGANWAQAPDGSTWLSALHHLGTAGYWLGNVVAFIFPIPQIYKTFKDGGAQNTPAWRAMVGATASLTLGLVSAPLLGQEFWGIQNTFGGLSLLMPLLLGPVLSRTKKGGFSAGWAALLTGLTAGLTIVPAGALYLAAAASVPAALAAVMTPAAISLLGLGIQIATGAMFFLLFVPDIISILKGEAPKGFTSMFSLLFLTTSLGFLAWTLQMAAFAQTGAESTQFLVYALQNAAYAVVAFISWLYIRRQEHAPEPESVTRP
ncbi:MAG: hypothetical protein HYZ75_05355 [Elusimicrobia bacterium]|nr:hypothetical protein [Elusimicrobiota bacterium]